MPTIEGPGLATEGRPGVSCCRIDLEIKTKLLHLTSFFLLVLDVLAYHLGIKSDRIDAVAF